MSQNAMALYQPLAKRQIRVLRLIGLKPDRTPVLELKTSSLDASYCALSCHGGDTRSVVVVNDTYQSVRGNLLNFLQSAAQAPGTEESWMFIDELSINQPHLEEKASQVSMLADIYRHAELVIAWQPSDHERLPARSALVQKHLQRWTDSTMQDGNKKLAKDALRSAYWTQMVVTELLVSKAVFVYGTACFTLEYLRDNVDTLVEKSKSGDGVANHVIETRRPNYMTDSEFNGIFARRLLKSRGPLSFQEALEVAAGRPGAPHDRIFAFSGLTACHIKVDYSIPLTELYMHSMAALLASLGFRPTDTAAQSKDRRVALGDKIPGHYVLWALDVDLQDPLMWMVTRTIFVYFAPEDWSLLRWRTFAYYLVIVKYKRHPRKFHERFMKKKYNERTRDVIYSECAEVYKVAEAALKDGRLMKSHIDNEEKSMQEWIDLAVRVCDEAWEWQKESNEMSESKVWDEISESKVRDEMNESKVRNEMSESKETLVEEGKQKSLVA